MEDSNNIPWDTLFETAKTSRQNAYAPYSHYQVGASLLTTDDETVFTGCNVENAAYGSTICAERNAILSAVTGRGPGMRLRALLLVTADMPPAPPCGACLQVISEFADDDLPIRLCNHEGSHLDTTLLDLLPQRFRL